MSDVPHSLAALYALHAEIDERVAALAAQHGDRLQCRAGCAGCCVDGLTVFEIEADRIRTHHAALLAKGKPGPAGACAFLDDEGRCRVYADRPYVCRTQGLPLRWFDHDRHAELRDICELNEPGPPLEALDADDCWLLGPYEGRLAYLQASTNDGQLSRVALRDLFA